MSSQMISYQVEEVIRQSEVMAVVREVRSGRPPRLGASVDYFIEAPGERPCGPAGIKKAKPYRVAVEQWHLDAAQRILGGRYAAAMSY